MEPDPTSRPPPRPRGFGVVNWRGVWSLYRRDVLRYFRYAGESIGGPAVTGLIFLAVFELALGDEGRVPAGISIAQFVVPGIVMFSLVHSAFENAAITLFHDKLEGMIGDIVGAPLTPLEIVAGYMLSATSNALTTGAVVLALLAVFVDLPLVAPALSLGFAVITAVLFALTGILVGLWCRRWDNYSAAETFLILPLGLLSGAFFSVDRLAQETRWIFALNPVFHAVEGFRYGFTGQANIAIALAAAAIAGLTLGFAVLAWRLFAAGYGIKA